MNLAPLLRGHFDTFHLHEYCGWCSESQCGYLGVRLGVLITMNEVLHYGPISYYSCLFCSSNSGTKLILVFTILLRVIGRFLVLIQTTLLEQNRHGIKKYGLIHVKRKVEREKNCIV